MNYIPAFIIRWILSLRYKVKVVGYEKLKNVKGALVLPNHAAEIDPVIVSAYLLPKLNFHPVVLEDYYYAPVIGTMIRMLGAVPVPDMDFGGGRYKRMRVEKGTVEAEELLSRGESLLFYPSGRLMSSGLEMLKGSSGVFKLMHASSDFPVVMVHTRGLWGSSFSRAQTGESPDFMATLLRGVKCIIKNFIFFAPKRHVTIKIDVLNSKIFSEMDVASLNRFIENYYNAEGSEPLSLVPYTFYSKKLPCVVQRKAESPLHDYDKAKAEKLREKISEIAGCDENQIRDDMRLGYDLGIDSLTLAEIVIWMKDEFDITDVELPDLNTVADIIRAAMGNIPRIADEERKSAPAEWNEKDRPDVMFGNFTSLTEAFFGVCERMGDSVACADEKSGVLTYMRFKLASLILSRELQKIDGENIGIMLPASVGASLSLISMMIAGRIPVMLNWTAGRKNINHAINGGRVDKIITSRAFIDMLEDDFDYLLDRFIFLEDVKSSISIRSKIQGLMYSRMSAQHVMKKLFSHAPSKDDTAVILFTSGSEAVPKGVPLSHGNILSNIEGAMEALNARSGYIMYSFLPPFHSFGLTATTLFPLLTGIKHAFYPNPNASRKLAAGCRRWGITLIAGTPSFIKNIFIAGEPEMFVSLKLVVSGAEKTPETLFSLVSARSGAELCEGYGITECSPVVCVNFPGQPHSGVGRPLKDVRIKIVSEDLSLEMPESQRGLILIKGPNVFGGYLSGSPDPFVMFQNERWYNSGDLGFMKDGHLQISGRLKRFVKIGGEMISLPAIEEALKEKYPDTKKGPAVAVVDVEKNDGCEIVLAISCEAELAEVNQTIFSAGLPAVARIRRIVKFEKIPQLGSGKADIQQIKRIAGGDQSA